MEHHVFKRVEPSLTSEQRAFVIAAQLEGKLKPMPSPRYHKWIVYTNHDVYFALNDFEAVLLLNARP